MADTNEFFEKDLPAKITPELQASVKDSIQFDITGAGIWTLDLSTSPGAVVVGPIENPGCIITVAKADWEKILDNPSAAMQLFMMGKVKATKVALALQLQKILA